jgi:hypothetical protein
VPSKNKAGCRCCGCNWTVVVHYCGGTNAAGALVEVAQSGVTIDSCTTDGTGACILGVPSGTYDLTITPASGMGHATYTDTLAHTCNQSTTVTLSPAYGFICQGGASCCPSVPGSLTLTFTFGPGYVGFAWPNDTLNWNGADWIGAGTFTDGGGDTSRYRYPGCSGGVIGIAREVYNTVTGQWDDAGGFGLGANDTNTCDPYIQSGAIGGNPYPSSKWTVMG